MVIDNQPEWARVAVVVAKTGISKSTLYRELAKPDTPLVSRKPTPQIRLIEMNSVRKWIVDSPKD